MPRASTASIRTRIATRCRPITGRSCGRPTAKKALLGWYHSDVHQRAMKAVFPNQSFDREPLPDLADDSGPILAIVSVKLADGPRPDAASTPISSIGIELYSPLPGGVAVGGRF